MSDVNDTQEEVIEEVTEEAGEDSTVNESEAQVDYKAEYEKLTEIDRKKTGALKEERQLRKEAEAKASEGGDLDEDKIAKVAKQILAEERRARTVDELEDILDSECSDPDHRKLVRYHYENSIKTTGESKAAIRRDIENAKLLADKSKFMSEVKKKAQKSEAEKATFMKESKGTRSVEDDGTKKGVYVNSKGEEARPKTAAERRLLQKLGVKKT